MPDDFEIFKVVNHGGNVFSLYMRDVWLVTAMNEAELRQLVSTAYEALLEASKERAELYRKAFTKEQD